MGIAVSTATDVAKSAASMVLTEPGLKGIVIDAGVVIHGSPQASRIEAGTFSLNDAASETAPSYPIYPTSYV